MQDKELYAQILGIRSPWSVDLVELKLEAGEVHIHLVDEAGAAWWCPECGQPCPLYDHQPERRWRHLDTDPPTVGSGFCYLVLGSRGETLSSSFTPTPSFLGIGSGSATIDLLSPLPVENRVALRLEWEFAI